MRAYRQEEIEAGQAFATEVRHSIDLLLRHPEIAPAIGRKHVRRKVLRRFPYSLFYVIEPDRIRILAVAHQSRRPGYWASRL